MSVSARCPGPIKVAAVGHNADRPRRAVDASAARRLVEFLKPATVSVGARSTSAGRLRTGRPWATAVVTGDHDCLPRGVTDQNRIGLAGRSGRRRLAGCGRLSVRRPQALGVPPPRPVGRGTSHRPGTRFRSPAGIRSADLTERRSDQIAEAQRRPIADSSGGPRVAPLPAGSRPAAAPPSTASPPASKDKTATSINAAPSVPSSPWDMAVARCGGDSRSPSASIVALRTPAVPVASAVVGTSIRSIGAWQTATAHRPRYSRRRRGDLIAAMATNRGRLMSPMTPSGCWVGLPGRALCRHWPSRRQGSAVPRSPVQRMPSQASAAVAGSSPQCSAASDRRAADLKPGRATTATRSATRAGRLSWQPRGRHPAAVCDAPAAPA
jgi:hypothetical protein